MTGRSNRVVAGVKTAVYPILFAGLALWCGFVTAGVPQPQTGRWQKLPGLPGRAEYVSHIALERGNVLWAMGGTTVAYWDGSRFRRPQGEELSSGPSVECFVGGTDRVLYVTRRGTEKRQGKIYRLSDGTAQYVTDFHYRDAGYRPGVYVAKSGRLFNWGAGLLAVHTDNGWKKIEAGLKVPGTFVFDAGKNVYFYYNYKLYGVDPANNFSVVDVPVRFDPDARDIKGALWGNDRALMLAYAHKGVQAFELATGRAVDTSKINGALGGENVFDLFTAPDGSVWVMAHNRPLQSYVFHRVTPQGECRMQPRTDGYAWDNHQFTNAPRSVFCAADGSFWFGMLRPGILHYRPEGKNRFFDGGGLNLAGCTELVQDSKGTVYAASSYGIYVLRPGPADLLDGQIADTKPTILEEVAWKHQPQKHERIGRAWQVGDSIVVASSRNGLYILDETTGRRRAQVGVGRDFHRHGWVVRGRNSGEMLLSASGQIRIVDLSSGKRRQTTSFPVDSRIAPVPLEDGYLVVKNHRGHRLVRIDHEGQELWNCPLSGYVQPHPTVYGAFVVVQTRRSSYGGQRTVGVDLNNGDVLWSEETNAYGRGAAFGDDAAYVVESDRWLSPKATEGWLICREPKSGKRLWHYRRSGMLRHSPLVDRKTDRVFGVFDRGEVVCLRGTDGRLLWETCLPENPHRAVAFSCDSYGPVMALHGDRLMVLDRNNVLQVLAAETGKPVARLALTSAFSDDGKTMVPVEILAMPWIAGENLIVASRQGIAAYPVAQLVGEDE